MYVGSQYEARYLILPSSSPEKRLRQLCAEGSANDEDPSRPANGRAWAKARYHRLPDEAALRAALARHAPEKSSQSGRASDVPANTPASYRDLLRQLRAGEELHQFILEPERPARRYQTEKLSGDTLFAGRFTLSAVLGLTRYAAGQAMGSGRLTLFCARRRGQRATYALLDEHLEGLARSEAGFTALPDILARTEKLEAARWLSEKAIRQAATGHEFASFFGEGVLKIWVGPHWLRWALSQMPAATRERVLSQQITDPDDLPDADE